MVNLSDSKLAQKAQDFNPQLILSDAARRAGMWLAYEEDFVFLKSGDNTLCEFTHHAPPHRIREAADLFLTGVRM